MRRVQFGANLAFGINFALPCKVFAGAAMVLGLTAPLALALPMDLVTDGKFQNTTATQDAYLCSPGTSTSCVDALSKWTVTCSQQGCGGSTTPASILFGTDAAYDVMSGREISNFNPGFQYPGLWWAGAAGTTLASPGGGNVVAMDGDGQYASVISQTITGLTVGNAYTLSFYQAAAEEHAFDSATTEDWKVTLGSTSITSPIMHTAAQSSTGWALISATFEATATSETLSFLAQGTPSGAPPIVLLSDVSLVQASEPASLAVFAAAMILLGILVRRHRSHTV